MRFSIVDVFAEAPYSGNQLAVVRDAARLHNETMQAIAREMNFSETTFVTRESPHRARVRIFTPGEELPFAGHPTLGTAWVLSQDERRVVVELDIGDVEVRIDGGTAWMSPPAGLIGDEIDWSDAAAMIGLEESDLDSGLGPCIIECGLRFALIGVDSIDALRRVRVDLEGNSDLAPFVVCRHAGAAGTTYGPDADFAARMFFHDGSATREDPATGSANSAFAHYLRSRGQMGRFIVEQGFEIDRPSRIYLDVGDTIRVGGKVRGVVEGSLIAEAFGPGDEKF